MIFLLHGLPGLFGSATGLDPPRIDHARCLCFLDTLTCHFFQWLFSTLKICALAVGMIKFRCTARLISAVDFFALKQSSTATAGCATVAMASVAGAADEKYDAAFRTPAYSVAYFYVEQGSPAFPKAGLDNGRQSWQARSYGLGWFH
jgi:hypothetical protein